MYGAAELPMISLYEWFSSQIQITFAYVAGGAAFVPQAVEGGGGGGHLWWHDFGLCGGPAPAVVATTVSAAASATADERMRVRVGMAGSFRRAAPLNPLDPGFGR
jgi:hypothetical protein